MTTTDRLREIEARCEAATSGAELVRYDHGGGRLYKKRGSPNRELVADFYDEANREFYFSARTDIPYLLGEVRRLREALAGCWCKKAYGSEGPETFSPCGKCEVCIARQALGGGK
jgi:hypothetical protein